jgi:hypothetical protein
MTIDVYAWKEPRDIDAERAGELVDGWLESGGDPVQSPFEPSTDVSWFHRELTKDDPRLETLSDGPRNTNSRPIFLETDDPPAARVVRVRVPTAGGSDTLDNVYSLAVKYDLVVFSPDCRSLRRPLDELAAYASATFWPSGAIRALRAGAIGAALAIGAWFLNIPIASGVAIVIGAFLVVLTVFTFVHEGRKRWGSKGTTPTAGGV